MTTEVSPCYWPWLSVVIDSQGYIKPCCIMTNTKLLSSEYYDEANAHIETIDDLSEYLLTDFPINIRNKLIEEGLNKTKECSTCAKAEKRGNWYRHDQSQSWKNQAYGVIKFLEVTSSNICNQTCVTCNSYFSTKWQTIEHLFTNNGIKRGEKFALSDSSIEKITSVFPTLTEFVIKGGEPFSDLRNAKMLERLIEVNPDCRIHITSNVSFISKKYINILKKVKNPNQVELHGSLDHIGKKYEWIRGTSFDKTLKTIKQIYEETGIVTKPSPTLSYFNILDLKEIKDFYEDYPYTKWFKKNADHYNWVYFPQEMDPLLTRTQEELDTVYESGVIERNLISRYNENLVKILKEKIEIMDNIRGFKWNDKL